MLKVFLKSFFKGMLNLIATGVAFNAALSILKPHINRELAKPSTTLTASFNAIFKKGDKDD